MNSNSQEILLFILSGKASVRLLKRDYGRLWTDVDLSLALDQWTSCLILQGSWRGLSRLLDFVSQDVLQETLWEYVVP